MTNYVTVLIYYDTLFDGHIYNAFKNKYLGAVHMSRASPANRADLSHENLYFSTT